jgi:type IV pilus assembly protein PilZ
VGLLKNVLPAQADLQTIAKADSSSPLKPDLAMKFPVITIEGHQGKALEMNAGREVLMLHSATGELLGTLSWGVVIEQILASDDDTRFAHARSHPRAPLAVKVRYTTPEGRQFDSLTGGIGAGGLFIESSAPLAPGTELAIEFALPDRPWGKHQAKAKVAWTRNKAERHLLFPGMGVQFTNIDENARKELGELVDALNRSRLAV